MRRLRTRRRFSRVRFVHQLLRRWAQPTLLLRGDQVVQLGAELLDGVGVLGVFGEIGEFLRVFFVVVELEALLAFVPFGVAIVVGAEAVAFEGCVGLCFLLNRGIGIGGFGLGLATSAAAAADLRQGDALARLAG